MWQWLALFQSTSPLTVNDSSKWTRCHETNSHEVNCHQVNSHEINLPPGQLSQDQLATRSTLTRSTCHQINSHEINLSSDQLYICNALLFMGQENHSANTKKFWSCWSVFELGMTAYHKSQLLLQCGNLVMCSDVRRIRRHMGATNCINSWHRNEARQC